MLESLKDVLPLRLFQIDCCFDFMNVLLVLCVPQLPSIRAARDLSELQIVSAAINTQPMRRVEVWFVPSGGQLPSSVTNAQSVSTLSLDSLGCPK